MDQTFKQLYELISLMVSSETDNHYEDFDSKTSESESESEHSKTIVDKSNSSQSYYYTIHSVSDKTSTRNKLTDFFKNSESKPRILEFESSFFIKIRGLYIRIFTSQ